MKFCPFQSLNKLLEVFYWEVKSMDGSTLSKSTFVSLRSGISKHLRNPPFKRNVCPSRNVRIQVKNNSLFQKYILTKSKLQMLSTLNTSGNCRKRLLFFFLPSVQFWEMRARKFEKNCCLALREMMLVLSLLNWVSMEIKKSRNGWTTRKTRMYAAGTECCPLNLMRLYLSKLYPNFELLYAQQVTAKTFYQMVCITWYNCKGLGHGCQSAGFIRQCRIRDISILGLPDSWDS